MTDESKTPDRLRAIAERADPMLGAPPCKRKYPIDALTAEDPCEDCGRDQRKHDFE